MIKELLIHFNVICCFGDCFESTSLSFSDLLLFSLWSFFMISFLLWFYSKIPKSNSPKSDLDNPIYQSKDILLNPNSCDVGFVVVEKTTTTWTKVLLFVLILCIAFTPFQEFLGL